MSLPMDYGTNFGRNMVCAMLFDLLLLLNSVLLSAGNCGEGVSRIRQVFTDLGPATDHYLIVFIYIYIYICDRK